jgi:CheY-like chemotaxis protein
VVDDNQDSAESLAMLLQSMGNEAHTAHDGEQALEAAEQLRPQLILLDIGMPRLNGYETCRAMRRRPLGSSTSIVALTGWGQEADKVRAKEAGFDAHLVKPVDRAALARLLATVTPRPAPHPPRERPPARRNLDPSPGRPGA